MDVLRMLNPKLGTLLTAAELGSFTRAAAALNLTQPAVSHHISQLEQQLGVTLFVRAKGKISLTPEGEIVVQYVRRMKALEQQLLDDLQSADRRLTRLRVGITHTAESNLITEVLAKFGQENDGVSITITTDTIKNLYDAMEHFELDLAVVDSTVPSADLNALLLDTDCIMCVLSNNNPLSRHAMVTLEDLKKERMILRLPSSATRKLFEAHLLSLGMSIDAFDVAMEVDNIATIKDLIRKDLGGSRLTKASTLFVTIVMAARAQYAAIEDFSNRVWARVLPLASSLLRKLKSDGLVTTYLQGESGGPPRKYYKLTQLGLEHYLEDRAEYLRFAHTVEKLLEGNDNDKA